MKLTDYQSGQLLHIYFNSEFKYRTDAGTRVPSAQWRKMISALVDGGYVECNNGARVTAKGREYLDKNHLTIKTLG